MPKFDIFENDVLVNIIEADSIEDAEMVTGLKAAYYSSAPLGSRLDPETGEFTPREEPPVIPVDPMTGLSAELSAE